MDKKEKIEYTKWQMNFNKVMNDYNQLLLEQPITILLNPISWIKYNKKLNKAKDTIISIVAEGHDKFFS